MSSFRCSLIAVGLVAMACKSSHTAQTPSTPLPDLCADSSNLGVGSVTDPYYLRNAADLAKLEGSTSHFRLCADLDLSQQPAGLPIQEFEGSLDGNSHTLSNFSAIETTDQPLALIRTAAHASFSNLVLQGFDLSSETSRSGVGALVGLATMVKFTAITIKSSHLIALQGVGSLVGVASDSSISKVTVTHGHVETSAVNPSGINSDLGGIVGTFTAAEEPTVENIDRVRVTDTVLSANNWDSGGIAGICANCHIRYADVAAEIDEGGFSGGIVGVYTSYTGHSEHTLIRDARFEGNMPPNPNAAGCVGGLVGGDEESSGTVTIEYALSLAHITNADAAVANVIACPEKAGNSVIQVFTSTDEPRQIDSTDFPAGNVNFTGPAAGLSISQLESVGNFPTHTDWTESSIWFFDGTNLPVLKF